MTALLAITRTQVRRTIRSRVFLVGALLGLGFAALVMILIFKNRTEMGSEVAATVAWDVLWVYSVGGFMLAASLGGLAIESESRDKTWQALLTKPVQPWHVVTGKFLAVMILMSGVTVIVWLSSHAMLALGVGQYGPRIDLALAYQTLSFAIPTALVICLSMRIPVPVAVIVTLLLRYDLLGALYGVVTASQLPTAVLAVPALLVGALQAVAPPYEVFNLSDSLESSAIILWKRQAWVACYAVIAVVVLLALASRLLRYREFAKSA